MKKNLILVILLVSFVYANKAEQQFWNEVKDTQDIELLKLYKEKYPKGVFESLADIKIKRLIQAKSPQKAEDEIPLWIKGTTPDYQYYGVGKANSHFKGKHYQENLARSRAKKELMLKLENGNLSQEKIYEYLKLVQTATYTDKRERIYILLYIDNYDL